MSRLRFWWLRLLDWLAPEQAATFIPPRLTVELAPFNWLEDYGPHWEPGSTAFWLEPRRESDLSAWLRKYRPDFAGEFEAAGLTVVVKPLVREATVNGTAWAMHSGTRVLPAAAPDYERANAKLQADLLRANAQMQNNLSMYNAAAQLDIASRERLAAQLQANQKVSTAEYADPERQLSALRDMVAVLIPLAYMGDMTAVSRLQVLLQRKDQLQQQILSRQAQLKADAVKLQWYH